MANTATYQASRDRQARAARLRRSRQRQVKQQAEIQFEEKKMTGFLFYLILGLAVLKDALDPILSLSIILAILVFPLTFLLYIIFYLYRVSQGATFSMKQFTIYVLIPILEALPFVSMVPAFTVGLLASRYFINKDIKKRNEEKKKQLKKLPRKLRA